MRDVFFISYLYKNLYRGNHGGTFCKKPPAVEATETTFVKYLLPWKPRRILL